MSILLNSMIFLLIFFLNTCDNVECCGMLTGLGYSTVQELYGCEFEHCHLVPTVCRPTSLPPIVYFSSVLFA